MTIQKRFLGLSLSILGIVSALAGVDANAASDCHDFSGPYDRISGSEKHIGNPGMRWEVSRFEITQDVCDQVTLMLPYRQDLDMKLVEEGQTLSHESSTFIWNESVTVRPSKADPTILEVTYKARNRFLGNWAYAYEYSAQFKKR